MADAFQNGSIVSQSSPLVVVGVGGVLTSLGVTNAVPFQYAAPAEWLGVFCLMSGLTWLSSVWLSVLLSSSASILGTIMDPVFIGGQSFQAWALANGLVFVFAMAGTGMAVLVLRLTSSRKI